ncbi:MAG: response regulator transcription factor [Pleurocapsa minor GSE-CHR-MK-17-07R]|jgi:DNA-binding NarL/FixJ family response regulator|nr:response regulator transcription factor [Pleurocapsa minor GSE-CHR-MK 17-07R]
MTLTPLRILLADDHAILRAGLRLLLSNEPGWEVVDEAENGAEALAKATQLQPDVLLLDINMPQVDGLSVIPALRVAAPATRILVLTMHDDGSYLTQAIQSGAAGYVLKKAVDTELLMAIRAVMRGETYVHSAMMGHLLNPRQASAADSSTSEAGADPWKELSEREFDVLKRVALGYTNAEIADELFLSTKTVETYRARGMEKLGMDTRARLVKSAMEHGHLK